MLDMQNRGLSAAYIKTELAAIRFWHDKISRPRYRLPSNSELGIDLEKRHFGGVDRTWTNVEVEAMCRIAASMGRRDYITAIILGRYAGLRLEEALGLDRAAAEAAIRTGELTVKGKGGRVRTIPVAPEVAETLKAQMKTVRRGSKLWVPEDMPTHTAMAQMEAFLAAHRDEVADLTSDRKVPLTFHGLRHTYAAVKYHALRDVGMSEKEARRRVSELLGHNREDVTKVYTYSVEG